MILQIGYALTYVGRDAGPSNDPADKLHALTHELLDTFGHL